MKEYKRLHIDIGANDGKAVLHYARFEPNTYVIAIEPVPILFERIKEESKNLNNIKIVQAAVSDFEGDRTFNVSPPSEQYGDFACSSLLEFSDKSKTEWENRPDFKVIHQIPVKVIRMDNFFIANDITFVDYIKIDTQGNDLNVLKGCGELLQIIDKGEMEAAVKSDVLYKGQNTLKECIEFLEQNNFQILDIISNDVHTNEVNILFQNKNPKRIEYKKIYEFYDK